MTPHTPDHAPAQSSDQQLLDAVLKTGVTLPAPDVAFARLQMVAASDYFGPREMAAVILRDPALTGAVLRVANSPVFRPRAVMQSVQDAVTWLGRTRTLAVAASTAMHGHFAGVDARLMQRLWDASLRAAEGSWRCAQASKVRNLADAAYLAALLQDVGVAVLLRRFPAHAYLFDTEPFETAARLLGEVNSVDHAALGMLVVRNWKLPQNVAEAIRCHHDPAAAARLPPEAGAIAALVAFGRVLRDGPSPDWHPWAELTDHLLGLDPAGLGGGVAA